MRRAAGRCSRSGKLQEEEDLRDAQEILQIAERNSKSPYIIQRAKREVEEAKARAIEARKSYEEKC